MSTIHTPGRVTFKEDLDANHYFMVDENNHWWMKLLVNGEQINERQIANFRRLAACWNWCIDIPTDKLETKSIDEYVSEQAFLTGMAPAGDAFGFGLNGLACQMLAASFAGQFVGSGAVNFLEVNMSHPEIGPFTVTIQRHQGKTPGQMKAEVEQKLEAERASLFAESQRKQQLEARVNELESQELSWRKAMLSERKKVDNLLSWMEHIQRAALDVSVERTAIHDAAVKAMSEADSDAAIAAVKGSA